MSEGLFVGLGSGLKRLSVRAIWRREALGFLVASTLFAGNVYAADGDWEFQLTPYLWLPVIEGDLKYDVPTGAIGSPTVEAGPTDWLDLLNYGLLMSGTARKDRFSVFSDVVYLNLSTDGDGRVVSVEDSISIPGTRLTIPVSGSLEVDTDIEVSGLVWTLAPGYRVHESVSASVDVFAGVRYFGVDTSTEWNLTASITSPIGGVVLPAQGRLSQDKDLWDGILGVRGELQLGQGKWTLPFHLDAGTGSSDLTWNAMVGLSYEFSWGDFLLLYRHLEYDQPSDKLLQNFSFGGPGFGARFHF